MLQEEEIINKKETKEANALGVVKSHIWWGGWEGCSFKAVILEYLQSVLLVLPGGFASQLPWIPI